MQACRETVVVSPLSFCFERMHLDIDATTSPRQHNIPDRRSLSWGGGVKNVSEQDGTNAAPSSQAICKIGSGDLKKKIKKNRPSLQQKHIGVCVEQFIHQRFNEEDAELATLCLDFATEIEQRGDLSPRCPAPDPSMMHSRPKKTKPRKLSRSAIEETISAHPFGLRPRQKRKKPRFQPPPDFSNLTDDEELSAGNESEFSPPLSPKPRDSASLRRCHSMEAGSTSIDIPLLDFGKLSVLRERAGPLLSPHPSPPRSPSSPNVSKPDSAKYKTIEGSPRSAFFKPSTG